MQQYKNTSVHGSEEQRVSSDNVGRQFQSTFLRARMISFDNLGSFQDSLSQFSHISS